MNKSESLPEHTLAVQSTLLLPTLDHLQLTES
jgi:hypothetical protein